MAPIQKELRELQTTLEGYASDFGLDYFDVQFEMLDYKIMSQLAAYDGFPTRYPHWRFGMEYERLSKSYAYGLHRIYEMVINTNPCYAYLLVSNLPVDQKLVIVHVLGHSDFFKNNLWFAHTNRKMLDEMANHATRIQRHIERHGHEEVESFLDACLSLNNLIDIHAAGIRRRSQPGNRLEDQTDEKPVASRIPASVYMDPFINPPEFLAEQQRKLDESKQQAKRIPAEPEHDVMLFLLEHARLESWQYDVLDIVREESYYFAPQQQTKIMNEGWASYVHTHLMTNHALTPDELIDYADHHSSTVATQRGRLNPYKLGLELYRDIEDRWNRGAFGSEYEACEDYETRRRWDTQAGLGRQKIFEVRRIYNDVGFIDEFLTEEFARKHQLFTFEYNDDTDQYEIASRKFQAIKRKLLFQLTNFGQPIIDVVDANYENRGELYLMHHHEGMNLDVPYAEDTLNNLYTIWSRPVHIETKIEDVGRVLFSRGPEGREHKTLEKLD